MNFDIIVENKIREAIDAGVFDNLQGAGQPLRLDENPHEPAAWRLAHRLLKDNDLSLPWIAERKEIEEALEAALKRLAQAYQATHANGRAPQPDVWAQAEWRRAEVAFTEAIRKLNKSIRDYNLSVPSLIFQRSPVEAEKALAQVASQAAAAAMWAAAK